VGPLDEDLLAQQGGAGADRGGFPGDTLHRPVGDRRCDDGMCSGTVVWRPLPEPRMWAATRSPRWNSSMVRAVIRASIGSRAKQYGTE